MKINLLDIPVYYITTQKSIAKDQRTNKILRDIGFKNINRFEGVYIKTPKVGCATSHNMLIESLLDVDHPVLILEDDVDIENFRTEIEVPDNSDAVYLGITTFGLDLASDDPNKTTTVEKEIINEEICRIYNMLSAHAVLLITKSYKEYIYNDIKKQIEIKDHQDKARARSMGKFNVYALRHPIFYQSGYNTYCTRIKF